MPGQALTVAADDLDGLAAGLRASGEALADLSGPNREAAALALAGVRPPRDIGRLAATVDAEVTPAGITLTAGSAAVDYAGFVHSGTRYMRGRPFLADAVDQRTTAIFDTYLDHADHALGLIPGV